MFNPYSNYDFFFSTERENTATASPTQTPDGTTKSGRSGESGRGGRKKYALIIHKLIRFPCMLFNGLPFWIHASKKAPLISTVQLIEIYWFLLRVWK